MATRAGSDRAPLAASPSTNTPVLEVVHVRSSALAVLPPRFSHSSSSNSNSNRSIHSSGRRLATSRHRPSLRRSQAQDSDPCMLGSSFDGWSDDEEDETKESDSRHAAPRPVVRRNHTDNTGVLLSIRRQNEVEPTAMVSMTALSPPVAPLTIRVRKFASTSALDVKSSPAMALPEVNETTEASSISSSMPPSPLPLLLPGTSIDYDRVDAELSSVVEEGGVVGDERRRDRDRDDEMLRAGRFDAEQLSPLAAHGRPTDTLAEAPPPQSVAPVATTAGRTRWFLKWTTNPRFRQWYGRILNSYFAFWLVVCSLVVALLELLLLLTVVIMDRDKTSAPPPHYIHWCHALTRKKFGPIHYLGAAACVALALPVLFPIRVFGLYHKRADRRMVRRPYLHLCELFVTIEVVYLVYFVIDEGYRLPVTVDCHRDFAAAEITFLYATLVLWGVLWWQLVVFCRFLVHLKLQADAANDSTHTSALSDWLHVSNHREIASSKARRPIQRFKKLLYRAAARGDTDAVNELVSDASLASYGIADGGDGVCRLYAAGGPTLWLYAFAVSCKNPLHIAAKRGHVAIVARLLALGFDANALDKVARVNFNLGLLFKIATRLLLKTQDGSKALLRPVLCSVLLPPLHGAVAAGHIDVVRLLLETGGADPNRLPRASFYHPSAVIPAIFLADDPEIVKLLVAKGANFLHVATTTLAGLASSTYATALQRSALTQRSATTEYLLSCGGDVALTPLHAAAAADNIRTVTRLLRQRRRHAADQSHHPIDHVDARGERVEGVQRRTPLHWAAVVGRVTAATILLDRGADPNARDRYGRTPLHWAAHNNHAHVVTLLLEYGADATAEDDSGVPVLSFAAESEGVETLVIAALVEAGASLKHQLPCTGDTPLHIALLRENRATATSLIRCGADLLASNNDDKRAVDVTTSTRLLFELKREAGTRDVMISYPHSHFAFAQRVREYLETHGKLTCWMDTMDPSGIGGGAVWREEIARGIHNCSLVVSIVCGGYTTSEWCLKELALAKMIRKPVVALLVEPPISAVDTTSDNATTTTNTEISALDALVPRDHQLAFHTFVRGTRVLEKRVELDVDDAALDAAWRDVLPQLKNAMQSPEHATGRWLKSESTMSSFDGSGSGIGSTVSGRGGRRLNSQTDSEPEREGEGDGEPSKDSGSCDEERKTDTDETTSLASSHGPPNGGGGAGGAVSVAVYSTIPQSPFLDRLVQDLGSEGFRARAVTVSSHDTDAQLTQSLLTCRVLVLVIESLGVEATREQRQETGASLAQLLRVAASVGSRVFPVVARDEFLSFSNLYTLSRSELLYFVGGAGERQSTAALLRQLRRAVVDRNEP